MLFLRAFYAVQRFDCINKLFSKISKFYWHKKPKTDQYHTDQKSHH